MSDWCAPRGYRRIFSEKSAHAAAKRFRRKVLDGSLAFIRAVTAADVGVNGLERGR